MLRVALAASIVAVMSLQARAAAPVDPNPASLVISQGQTELAKKLVAKLASNDYQEREKADQQLREMGRAARTALFAARNDKDAEVRFRCRALLVDAETDDFRVRANSFLADMEGKYQHDLPGWSRFRAIVGEDRPARELFVEMIKADDNRRILSMIRGVDSSLATPAAALFGGNALLDIGKIQSTDAAKALQAKRVALFARSSFNPYMNQMNPQQPVMPSRVDVAVVLFAESSIQEIENPHDHVRMNLLAHFTQVIATEQAGHKLLKKIAANWIENRTSPGELTHAMNLAQQWNLGPDVIRNATLRVVLCRNIHSIQRVHMLQQLMTKPTSETMPVLQELMHDNSGLNLANLGGQGNITMGAYALACAVHLTKQPYKEYGFQLPQGHMPNFQMSVYGNKKDAEKLYEAGITRWKQWETTTQGAVAGFAPAKIAVERRHKQYSERGSKEEKEVAMPDFNADPGMIAD